MITKMRLDRQFRCAKIILFAALSLSMIVFFGELRIRGADFLIIYNAVRSWPTTALYRSGGHFFLMPWGLLLYLPLTLLPVVYAQAALGVGGILCWLRGMRLLWRDTPGWCIMLAFLPAMSILLVGNYDIILAGALALTWWAIRSGKSVIAASGLWLLSIKPINVIVPAFVLLHALWQRPWRERLIVVGPVMLSLVASLVVDWRWPILYLEQAAISQPYQVTQQYQFGMWQILGMLGWLLNRHWLVALPVLLLVGSIFLWVKPSQLVLAVGTAMGLLLSPYVMGKHLFLLSIFVPMMGIPLMLMWSILPLLGMMGLGGYKAILPLCMLKVVWFKETNG